MKASITITITLLLVVLAALFFYSSATATPAPRSSPAPTPTPTAGTIDLPASQWYSECDGFVRTFTGVRGSQVINCEETNYRGVLWYRTCDGAAEIHSLTNGGTGVKCLKSPMVQPTPEVPGFWG